MRILYKILIVVFFVITTIFLYYILVLQKSPINNSSHFFKNRLNQVFVDSTKGCLDICLSRSYIKLETKATQLTVYPHDSGFAKDSDNVYYKYGEILKADPASFEVINTGLAEDKNGYILYTFRLHEYITNEIDKKYVFNPQSIEVVEYFPFNTMIIRVENDYYLIHLNPQPKSIELLSGKSLEKYSSSQILKEDPSVTPVNSFKDTPTEKSSEYPKQDIAGLISFINKPIKWVTYIDTTGYSIKYPEFFKMETIGKTGVVFYYGNSNTVYGFCPLVHFSVTSDGNDGCGSLSYKGTSTSTTDTQVKLGNKSTIRHDNLINTVPLESRFDSISNGSNTYYINYYNGGTNLQEAETIRTVLNIMVTSFNP